MYEKTVEELKNQIRIIDQKLPSVEESIKTYTQMTKNYQKERDEMIAKRDEYYVVLAMLQHIEEEKNEAMA